MICGVLVDECFFLTCRRVSLEKKIERGLRKKYDRHLGRQKKIEIRGATNNNDNNEKGGGRVLLERQCIFLFATQKRIRFRITKIFFKLFYKKKNLRESLGEETQALPPFTSQPSSGGLFISTYDVHINQPHFSLISSKQLFFSLKRGKRTV